MLFCCPKIQVLSRYFYNAGVEESKFNKNILYLIELSCKSHGTNYQCSPETKLTMSFILFSLGISFIPFKGKFITISVSYFESVLNSLCCYTTNQQNKQMK